MNLRVCHRNKHSLMADLLKISHRQGKNKCNMLRRLKKIPVFAKIFFFEMINCEVQCHRYTECIYYN